MKTCLYSGSYIQPGDLWARHVRYVQWYENLRDQLGFHHIVFADNASGKENRANVKDRSRFPSKLKFHIYKKHLSRGPGKHEYPFCWRALYHMGRLITRHGYQKIIAIDTDMFVLSGRLAEWIKNCNSGWVTVHGKMHDYPESALQILNHDAFPIFLKFTREMSWEKRVGQHMEYTLPFTHVEKTLFIGDRYGEVGAMQTPEMDWYGQATNGNELHFLPKVP